MPSLPELALKVAGRAATAGLMKMIAEVEVIAQRGLPTSFRMRLESASVDDLLQSVDRIVGKTLAPGTRIEIARARQRARVSILTGVVESVGLDLDARRAGRAPAILINGYDKAQLLTRGDKVRAFSDMRLSDVAAHIAAENGLKSKTDESPVATHLLQDGLTDWHFLWRLAERVGFDVFVAGDTLHFQASGTRGRSKLRWGAGLTQFSPVITRSRQTVEVTVHGWDPSKKEVVASASAAGGGRSEGVERLIIDPIVRTREEADYLAQSIVSATDRNASTGRGLLQPGVPHVMPGVILEIGGVGTQMGGEYYVGAATHRFTSDEYTTAFEIGDPVDVEVSGFHCAPPGDLRPSVVVGIVTDNQDPDGLGRVRVKFPWLSEDEESAWARLAVPMAGPETGAYFLPEVDDEVLVGFEHGDVGAPYVVGALWNGADRPPVENSDGENNTRLIRSRSGHEVRFDDSNDGGRIEVATRNGQTIRLDDRSNRIEIVGGGNGSTVVIDAGGGDIELRTTGDPGGSITLDSARDLELKAAGNITLEAGLNLEAEAGLDLEAKAAVNASLEGGAGTELKSGAITEVTGALVKIN